MIVLDTHAWIWALSSPEVLSIRAKRVVQAETEPGNILVSAISVWELWMLVKKDRIELTTEPSAFLRATHQDPAFRIVPIDEAVCRRSVELPDIHADPADRIILATGVETGCPIVSKDSRFAEYAATEIIW